MGSYINKLDWSTLVIYDETAPSCLRWNNGVPAGSEQHGYFTLNKNIDGTRYRAKAHRIIYSLFNTDLSDDLLIDHIDRDKSNNKISNLRAVDNLTSCHNRGMWSNNTSGKTGVYLSYNTNRYGKTYTYWSAGWRDLNKKQKEKSFSIEKLGYDEAFNLAVKYREEKLITLNKIGAKYTPTHGT